MAAATTMPSTVGRKKKVHPFHIFKYVFLILASIISIFPFLWMIICATNDAVDVVQSPLEQACSRTCKTCSLQTVDS